MTVQVVYATASAHLTIPGLNHPIFVRRGTHWLSSDPVVRAHPDFFTTDPSIELSTTVPVTPEEARAAVEAATNEPGERRSVRIPRQ